MRKEGKKRKKKRGEKEMEADGKTEEMKEEKVDAHYARTSLECCNNHRGGRAISNLRKPRERYPQLLEILNRRDSPFDEFSMA